MSGNSTEKRPRIRLSAGAAILRLTARGRRYLLLRAYSYWDFPKGEVEAGETPLQAAIREVREETGLDALEFRWGEQYRETAPYSRGKISRYYLACTAEERVVLAPNPVTGIREHMEYRWLEYPAATALAAPRVKLILEWAESLASGAAPDSATATTARERKSFQG